MTEYEGLVSPHGFDGHGPVPDEVRDAAKRIAQLRVKFVNQWNPAMASPLTTREVGELFDAAALQAEWMREIYDALHSPKAEQTEDVDVIEVTLTFDSVTREAWHESILPDLLACDPFIMTFSGLPEGWSNGRTEGT